MSPSRMLRRELLIIIVFLALTALMTWPWVLHLRNAVADEGDSYAHAYFLWWDYHQTFHDPLNLFNATIFYPYRYTLAFGENDYGISLLFFPLFALGLRPLTVYSVAAFLSFPFSGYGAFRLARTLSGSRGAAWIAGIVFAFIPYRFQHLSHLPLIFAGWIPLLFEALVLFTRQRSWTRASWLGLAFVMNALTCLTWFVLTLIPLGLSAIILLRRNGGWRERALWLRAGAALSVASLVLLPFLLPYLRVSQLHGFVRASAEVQTYSARPLDWLAIAPANKLWHGLGSTWADFEMTLFPGLLPGLLVLAALFLLKTQFEKTDRVKSQPTIFFVLKKGMASLRSEILAHGIIWGAIGFMGSFGLNFIFHRFLFEFVPLFRSLRVAVRWAMICYLGLALLAGLGAMRISQLLKRYWSRLPTTLAFAVLAFAILFEQRVAPLQLVYGDVNPDALTLYLKATTMSGGIVELPAGERSHRYMLRAADHLHPLVTARNSFSPPLEQEIESLTMSRPIPPRLLDLFESIPASYITVHNSLISPERRVVLQTFLNAGISAGRLRFVKSFAGASRSGLPERNDLYAVLKTEPNARSEESPPAPFSYSGLAPLYAQLVSDFQRSYLVYRFYKASYGRPPQFDEFMREVQSPNYNSLKPGQGATTLTFADVWARRAEFKARYDHLSDDQYIDALLAQSGLTPVEGHRTKLLESLRQQSVTRVDVLENVVDNNVFADREFNRAFVLMHYFAYLKRDPDDAGYQFWLHNLDRFNDHQGFTEAFAAATERQSEINER
jgi:hypothetical protein